MQNKSKIIKIGISIFVVILIIVGVLFGRPLYEQSKMKPITTDQLTEEVYAIDNGFVNCYLVKTKTGYIMVDACNNEKQVTDALEKLSIKSNEITDILLTHSDGDHVAALRLFPQAQVYLPEAEVQMVDGTTKRNSRGGNTLDTTYLTISDGDVIELGGYNIKTIITPGHTLGSMSFVFDEKYLFVGDTLSLKNGEVALFNSYFNMDDSLQKSSIDKLKNVKSEYIFTGHYGYSDDSKNAFASWQ